MPLLEKVLGNSLKRKKGTGYFFPVAKLLSKHGRLLLSTRPFFPSFGDPGFRRSLITLAEFLPGWLLASVYLSRHFYLIR
jgi:hypothetical protein